AARGSVVDLAVGLILGAAFGNIVKSAVDDVLMPPLGLLTGGIDFADKFLLLENGTPPGPYPSLELARTAGAVTLNYGQFINHVVAFLVVSFAVFLLVRAMNRMRRKEEAAAPTTRPCPHCTLDAPLAATRCPHCTAAIEAAARAT